MRSASVRAVANATCTAVTLYSGQLVAQSECSVVTTLAPVTGWWKVVYTTPTVYAVGIAPKQAEELGIDLLTAGYDLAATARAAVEADERGRVELYADRSRGLLIGAAAAGLYAEEWMSEITLAVRAETPLSILTDVVHAFPTYGEAVEPVLRELAERL